MFLQYWALLQLYLERSIDSMIESLSNFSFSEENKLIAVNILKKYPVDRKNSAVMPLLDIAQRQNDGWLSRDTIE